MERRYSVHGYGIPTEMIPITDSGNIKKTHLYQWIKVRKFLESEDTTNSDGEDSIILLPNSNDVLFRSGTTTSAHPGNAFFRGLIEMKHDEFKSGSLSTQAVLAEDIVKEIEQLNGSFLQWDSRGYWTKMKSRRKILFKVEVAIRDFKGRATTSSNRQSVQSSTYSFQRQDGSVAKRRKKSQTTTDSDGSMETELIGCGFVC